MPNSSPENIVGISIFKESKILAMMVRIMIAKNVRIPPPTINADFSFLIIALIMR